MNRELPSITKSAYSTTAYSGLGNLTSTLAASPMLKLGGGNDPNRGEWEHINAIKDTMARRFILSGTAEPPEEEEEEEMANTLRVVKVFIADTDENVPLERRLIYSGTEKTTDLTDQELFFDIDIKSLLDKHNEYRKTLINKKVKERSEMLESARIRDLKMVVVDLAKF